MHGGRDIFEQSCKFKGALKVEVTEPKTKEDFEKYFKLRWEALRKPWNQPEGTENDETDAGSIHAFIKNENGDVIAIGRLHFNNPKESQIRYMAVHPDYRGKNVGGEILKYLEQKAKEKGETEKQLIFSN